MSADDAGSCEPNHVWADEQRLEAGGYPIWSYLLTQMTQIQEPSRPRRSSRKTGTAPPENRDATGLHPTQAPGTHPRRVPRIAP